MKKLTSILCALVIALSASGAPRVAVKGIEKSLAKVTAPVLKLEKKADAPAINRAPSAASDAALTSGTYYRTGGSFYVNSSSGWQDATSYMPSVEVTVDGNNVSIKGLAYYFENGAIQGTMNGNTITFANGQLMGTDEYGNEYLVGSNDGETVADNIVFVYDPAAQTLTSQTALIVESSSATALRAYAYWEEPVFGASKPEAPKGGTFAAEDITFGYAEEYEQAYYQLDFTVEEKDASLVLWINVDKTAQDVVSGKTYALTDMDAEYCYIETNGMKIAFKSIQFTKTVAADGLSYTIAVVIVDENDNTWNLSYAGQIPIELPAGVTTSTYAFAGTSDESQASFQVEVGFDGATVYIQGLSQALPDAWVKGTLADGKVTIPELYMGIYEYYTYEFKVAFSGATFTYDAQNDKFTCESYSMNIQNYGQALETYTNVTLTKIAEKAATPADPSFNDFQVAGRSYPYVAFTIPTKDTEGNDLIGSKLSYMFFVQKGNESAPLVLTTDLYEGIEANMTEIPYTFSDDYDIYNYRLYLNQEEDELRSWNKLGLQSIYRGAGVENKSNIVWFDVTAYWAKVATGIDAVKAEQKTVKRIDNGQLIIIKNGVRYNVLGATIK